MAEKILKSTEDTQVKKKRTTASSKNDSIDDIYKIDFEQDNLDLTGQEESQDSLEIQEETTKEPENKKTKKTTKKRKSKNIIKVVDDDEEEIDEIFGNVNKWLTEDNLEENVKKQKTRKKRLTKIEDGIKSSKTAKGTKTTTTRRTKKQIEQEMELENQEKFESIAAANIGEVAELNNFNREETPGEIKIHAENDVTEILLRHNQYKIELQKSEYNIYTEKNETSYIIVRDSGLKIISGTDYIFLQKQEEDYEITTNQDFKINYVIDNLTRKDNTVNFKLTNLTQIVADESGLIFEIDEEKVIENNLEDNHTLVISEEDGKVYLPYTKEEVKNEVMQKKGTKISEVIEDKYILPLDKYKNSIRARFREGYNLMYKREGKSKRSAIMLGIELMFETNLHPAIISACKNLEELDIYLDCLEDNELEKFSCFKIIYKSLPTLRKKAKFQEF